MSLLHIFVSIPHPSIVNNSIGVLPHCCMSLQYQPQEKITIRRDAMSYSMTFSSNHVCFNGLFTIFLSAYSQSPFLCLTVVMSAKHTAHLVYSPKHLAAISQRNRQWPCLSPKTRDHTTSETIYSKIRKRRKCYIYYRSSKSFYE